MEIVWRRGPSAVKDVWTELPEVGRTAYNTVQTMLNILADKGYLARRKEGRAFVYEPLVSRSAARARALRHLTQQFFGGSRDELLLNLLEGDPDAGELEDLRRRLSKARDEESTS